MTKKRILISTPYYITPERKNRYFKVIKENGKGNDGNGIWFRIPIMPAMSCKIGEIDEFYEEEDDGLGPEILFEYYPGIKI